MLTFESALEALERSFAIGASGDSSLGSDSYDFGGRSEGNVGSFVELAVLPERHLRSNLLAQERSAGEMMDLSSLSIEEIPHRGKGKISKARDSIGLAKTKGKVSIAKPSARRASPCRTSSLGIWRTSWLLPRPEVAIGGSKGKEMREKVKAKRNAGCVAKNLERDAVEWLL